MCRVVDFEGRSMWVGCLVFLSTEEKILIILACLIVSDLNLTINNVAVVARIVIFSDGKGTPDYIACVSDDPYDEDDFLQQIRVYSSYHHHPLTAK